ncbi:MAG TPA: DUF4404 family protein [Steroidobacteraceae bacterium]
MSDENLRELLARLQERLNAASSIDAQTRQMLSTVMHDIDARLDRDEQSAPATATGPRLEAAAVRFETSHPGLAQLLRQVAALLGQAGI